LDGAGEEYDLTVGWAFIEMYAFGTAHLNIIIQL